MHTVHLQPLDTDSSPAIGKALAELREHNGGTLVLAPGRHLCLGGEAMPDGRTHKPSVDVNDLVDVTVDGQGATLVGRDIAGLFLIRDSRNVTVRNLTVAWEPLPHTSGRVVSLLPEVHAFDIEPQFPPNPPAGRIVQGVLAYSPERRRLADNGWEVYQTQGERNAEPTQVTSEGHLRIFQRRGTPLPEVGCHVVVRHQVYGYDAFVFRNCTNVLLEDVRVLAVPGMAVIGWGSCDLTIRRIQVVPADGGWMSATADAMHFGACRGRVTVEDSVFAGMGDDAINIHGMYGLATSRVDDRTLAVGRARMNYYYDKTRGVWDAPAAGDVIAFGGGEEPLLEQGQLVVAGAWQDPAQERTIVEFTESLPAEVRENTVLANLSTSPAVRIRRCTVRGNRARGMLLQSRDVLVEDCAFEDVSGAGLHICTDALDWWESLGSRDVTVKDCVFRHCNFGVARRAAALDIFSDLPQGRQSAAGVHRRLHIVNNTFEGNSGAAIHVGSSDGVEIRGNRFAQDHGPAVIVMNSRNVVISANTLVNGPGGVEVRGNSENVTVSTGAER